ncbi:MAG: MBL fold metallo-hydrolase [candidate division Zixibacteria bacterium]|nr:MBL fold metallo-hydrolase [candidate division Zixibacteria bacterium]MBU1469880.1 MBL fold metallo-hydrolase [candidate division Zixibacteria bacterium]MBU2624014.1 MBL fold metallo-hydrolase [candidate division Zixibacteria bacterium]
MTTRLTFYGAVGTTTGSRFLLETSGKKLLIDCGMFQGAKESRLQNWKRFPIPPAEIDAILLTHAHNDHSGYIPRLCHDGFSKNVHCTHATEDLCKILLKDSAKLQEEDAAWANKKGFSKHKPALPLYTTDDAANALELFAPVNYGQELLIQQNLRVKFKDAGHILGSAMIDVKTTNGRKVLFSGDLGRPNKAVLRDPVQVYDVDYLILESTYGDRLHDHGSYADELVRIIKESLDRGGVLVIPAFSVGRTQTLLYNIRELEEQGRIPVMPIFVDSPMAIDATRVFEKRISDLDLSSRLSVVEGKNIFQPEKVRFCRTRAQSQEINAIDSNAIVISASGMATGGRVLHHLAQRLPDPSNTVLFVGYQARGTRGRAILEGQEYVKVHGRHIPIKAHVETVSGFSGHADYNEILAWLMGFNRPPEKTFIVHGDPEASTAMADRIRERFGWDVVVPKLGESFDLEL